MRIGFMVPALHALSVGMKDGEHFFDVDPSALDVNMRARVAALISCGGAPTVKHDKYKEPVDCYGYVEPTGADLESFIAAHEARKAAEAAELEAKRLDNLRRDIDTAAGLAAALEAFKALPDDAKQVCGIDYLDMPTLTSDVRNAILGSRPWRAERDRRDALRAERIEAQKAAEEQAERVIVRALLARASGEALVERFDAGLLPIEENVRACEQVLFGSDLCALDTARTKCSRTENLLLLTAPQWAQRKALTARVEALGLQGDGWVYSHAPLILARRGESFPGLEVKATREDSKFEYSLDLAYSAEDLEILSA